MIKGGKAQRSWEGIEGEKEKKKEIAAKPLPGTLLVLLIFLLFYFGILVYIPL